MAKDSIEGNFEMIEAKILKDFYDMIRATETVTWVHWNMRDTYFGFSALEHRAKILGIDPVVIDDSKKVDLSKVIWDLEGPGYIDHPRLENLLRKNDILPRGFLSGDQEAAAFEAQAYIRLHGSTLSKVRAIWEVAELAASGNLRTDASWLVRHGRRPSDIGAAIGENWLYPVISLAFGLVGTAIGIAGFIWGLSQS